MNNKKNRLVHSQLEYIELAGVALQQVNDKSLCVPAIVQDALSEIRKLKGK